MNAKLDRALDLSAAIENAVKRIRNKDLVDLGTKVVASGADPGLAVLSKVMSSADIKSRLALTLQKAYTTRSKLKAYFGQFPH